jgi:trehalose synthase
MLQLVNAGHKSLADYATIATRGLMDEIRRLAEPLQGKRVVHLSATAFGGGVAEINYTLVPLMVSAGLDAEWRIIKGGDEFWNVTKTIHNALQGNPQGLTEEQRDIFRRYQELNAAEFEDDYDFVIVHDPQPAGMIDYFPDSRAHWIWRGHIDFSTPNREVFDFILPSIKRYDAAIFHMREYVPKAEGLPPCYIWPPAIDPLAPKNMALSAEDAAYIVDQFGIDVERPLLTQVSRFDPWKDPLGVIDAYRLVKEEFPGVQLALVGSMAHDDPEGWDFYNQTVAYAGGEGGLRADRHGEPLEDAPDRCRPRGGNRRADSGRRDRLARRLGDRVRAGVHRHLARPARSPPARVARQGVRAATLPDTSLASRLARPDEPAARQRHVRRRGFSRRGSLSVTCVAS